MNSMFVVAVHALVYLNHKSSVVSSEELAGNICTNPARVRKVMSKLKNANLVKTKEGSEGGYSFCCSPDKLSLNKVADALNVSFIKSSWRSGDSDKECLIASGMASLMDEIFMGLDQQSRNYLQKITISDLDERIFNKKKKE